jgi:alginate O-acetyltransferase complex protein AlgI
MGFYEPLLLFYVLPTFVVIHFVLGTTERGRLWTLLVASIIFYYWLEPSFVPLVMCSIAVDYFVSQFLVPERKSRLKSVLLTFGIAQNLAILFFYKYFDFTIHNINTLSNADLPLFHLALPVGVSFIVFEKISYLVDVSRGICPPAGRLRDYSLFVFLFPKLLAGPILKYHQMRDQILWPSPPSFNDLYAGFERFARGAIKKLLLADPVGIFANQVFSTLPEDLSFGVAWLGLLCFTLQIYFDFSGYSDMAIGLARIFGYRLPENFAMPYAARSITEFWRRWHMSLTTWIRDYLYIPLGGNQGSGLLTYRNLWICFLLSGLWHGANWTFIVWGAYNGAFLLLDRIVLLRILERTNVYVANLSMLFIVMLGWAIFRSPTLEYLGGYIKVLLNPFSIGLPMFSPFEVKLTAAIGVAVCAFPRWPFYERMVQVYKESPIIVAFATAGLMILFFVACARSVASTFQPFLYFRF